MSMWECAICGMDYGSSYFPPFINLIVGEEGRKKYWEIIKDFAVEQGVDINVNLELDSLDFSVVWARLWEELGETRAIWICSNKCLTEYVEYINKTNDLELEKFYE